MVCHFSCIDCLLHINFEDMGYSHLHTAEALHDEITKRAASMEGKIYLFFDEIQEVADWEKCINSLRVTLDCDIYYIRYCCDAYLFYQVKRQNLQDRQILASNEKYYIADHGIREAAFGGKTGEKEIDFVCDKRGEKLYVQIAYLLASEEIICREFGIYNNIRDNFPKYVVSLDEFDLSRNGIKHRNVRDFLLAGEWN